MNILTIDTLKQAPSGFEAQYEAVAEYMKERGETCINLEEENGMLRATDCWLHGDVSGADLHSLILSFANDLPYLRANDEYYYASDDPPEVNPDEAYERYCDDRACMDSYNMLHNMDL